ncbi:hypothetical protein BH11BAC2_BH11BAC2_15480 [soil metagenome]
MYQYDTVTAAVSDLIKRGYSDNLTLNPDHILCAEKEVSLDPNSFTIDEFYRFEGDSDPGDEMIVYAISSAEKGIKGILVNAFGPYSDAVTDALIEKLKVHKG